MVWSLFISLSCMHLEQANLFSPKKSPSCSPLSLFLLQSPVVVYTLSHMGREDLGRFCPPDILYSFTT